MLIEILAIAGGLILGVVCGLIPGLHINLILPFLILASVPFSSLTIILFVASLTIVYTFVSFIPSIFLGCPDEDTALAILPGHELLNKGKGHEAVMLALSGCLAGLFVILILIPLFIFILPSIFYYLKFIMFFVLLIASGYLILREKNKLLSLFIFLLAGFLGIASLNLDLKQSLLPLLSGLFGSSSLITSIIKKQKIPKQSLEFSLEKKELLLPSLASFLVAPLCSLLPSLGAGQAAIIGSDIIEEKSRRKFLILLGSLNTAISGLAFVALYSINKARTGSSAILQQTLDTFSFNQLIIILATIFILGIFSFFLTKRISRFYALNINKFNYQKISLTVLIFLSMVVLIFSGFLGFLVFIISTATGLLTILLNSRRTNLMGSLMLPSILLYLPI
ncbi:MAG: tripartite tricarboxylate transporter permease [Candidatus Pacearchaeota archaeon]|nr:tripartite tricarboxylate transporter permease [Candidatus Pacearchaeota archaeon]